MIITKMKKKDFDAVPYLDIWGNWEKYAPDGRLEFDSFVIIPVREKKKIVLHDSGFACMEFCLIDDKNEPIGRIGGYSDVINLDGIGGYGPHVDHDWSWDKALTSKLIPAKGWTMDCLPCGYLRVWTREKLFLESRYIGSNCEVYSESYKKKG